MSFYSKIVFGIKQCQRLSDLQTLLQMMRTLHIIISEHDNGTEYCERPGLHYHGIIEHDEETFFNTNQAITSLKTCCSYFKIEKCSSPAQVVMDLAQRPKMLIVLEIWKSKNLSTLYSEIQNSANAGLEPSDFDKVYYRMENIKQIIQEVLNSKSFEPIEICRQIKRGEFYIYEPDKCENLVEHSISLVKQKILNQSIVELCNGVVNHRFNYYTVLESVELVQEWCLYQNIDIEAFTNNLVKCLDNRNSLHFQGSSESGVNSIIRSIADACCLVGEVDNESTGFAYVWEGCLEKRCIIMHNPIFDEFMFEELENILRGKGTLIFHRQSTQQYLRPTPVIVMSIDTDEEQEKYIKRLQNIFLHSYVNLKPFMKLHSDKLLNPGWLSSLYNHFIGFESAGYLTEETWQMDREECEVMSPTASLSSTSYVGRLS